MRKVIFMCAALAIFAACTGQSENETVEPQSYDAVGMIKGIKSEGRVLVIDHEAIEGFMDAMTMPFSLDSVKLGKGLKTGDKVAFTLTEKDGDWPITKIEKVGK